jgi:hypothetical protein
LRKEVIAAQGVVVVSQFLEFFQGHLAREPNYFELVGGPNFSFSGWTTVVERGLIGGEIGRLRTKFNAAYSRNNNSVYYGHVFDQLMGRLLFVDIKIK